MKFLSQRGDTIIEVVLSMALLTSVLFIAWSITNRASQIILAGSDRIEMVNQIKEQSEIIKSQWSNEDSRAALLGYQAAGPLDANPCNGTTSAGNFTPTGGNVWYLNATDTNVDKVDTIKTVNDKPSFVYVQRKDGGPSYSDFYIRACWNNKSGSIQKQESSQVIVRLNQ
jgi:hypothetical protein